MTKISEILAEAQKNQQDKTIPLFSFEFYPPKTPEGVAALYKRSWRMQKQGPLFIDCTWGAGGSTSDLTMQLSCNMKKICGVEVNMHLTCTNIKTEAVTQALAEARAGGIENIVALRGDPPEGQEKWAAAAGGYECGLDLVTAIRRLHGDYFGISVAGYPEGHPNAITKVEDLSSLSSSERGRLIFMNDEHWVCKDEDFEKEMAYLKKKVDAGADCIITQLFYDFDVFIEFERKCREIGISVPIFPGIMPIANKGGFKRMTGFCKTRVPYEMRITLEAANDERFKVLGHEMVVELCQKLWATGKFPLLHFYALNLEKPVYAIMRALGITVIEPEKVYPEECAQVYAKLDTLVEVPEPDKKKIKA